MQKIAEKTKELKQSLVDIFGEQHSVAIQSLLRQTASQDLIHLTVDQIEEHGFPCFVAEKISEVIQFSALLNNQAIPIVSRYKHVVRSPEDAAAYLRGVTNETDEHFVALFLNDLNEVIGCKTLYVGSLKGLFIHPRQLMLEAVKLSCEAIILGHNQLSDELSPGENILYITKQLKESGDILQVPVLDHIIIGRGRFKSLKQTGYL